MNIKAKKDLLKRFFQMMLDAVKEEAEGGIKEKEKKKQEFDVIREQIVKHVKLSEIEGLLNYVYNELFILDPCPIYLEPNEESATDEVLKTIHGTCYTFIEETSKLYYYQYSNEARWSSEEVKIDVDKFKQKLTLIMENNKRKRLSKEEIDTLITSDTGHVPHRLINQIEAARFLGGSKQLMTLIHGKETNRNQWIAVFFTMLSCIPVVTIPFCSFVYHGLLNYLNSRKSVQTYWGERCNLQKLDELEINNKKISLFHRLKTSTEEIFDRFHSEELDKSYGYQIPFLKKSHFFNSSGELRKAYADVGYFKAVRVNGELVVSNFVLASKEQMFRLFGGGNKEEIKASKKRSKEQIESISRAIKNCP